MNRNVAQVARILGVDSTMVKKWVVIFKDFLSESANPPKGKTRSFNESDVLALTYICATWEAQPDLESIRAGLNDDEHYAEQFREQLYLHTPLFQEPPDDLDETWRHGILFCGGGMQEYLELARNYRHIAENLLDAALKSGEPLDYAYPVLFAYRHTLELYLKIVGEIDEVTHSLEKCVRLVEMRHAKTIGSPIRDWILELDKIDPRGTAFRYTDDGSSAINYTEHWLDLVQFKFAMNRIFQMLDGAILRLGAQGKIAKKHK
jgi:hypothetical protein